MNKEIEEPYTPKSYADREKELQEERKEYIAREEQVKRQIEKKEKLERIPISKEQFIMDLYEAYEFWQEKAERIGGELENIQKILNKLAIAEKLEMRIDYFEFPETGRVEFIARKKGRFGFRGVVKNNEERPAQK